MRVWRAAAIVTEADVERFGIGNCFAVSEIDDATFARMQGRSYKADCTLPRSELRYLKVLHTDIEGRIRLGELVCHRHVADDLIEIFRTLYDLRYPIERMVLIDDYDADDGASMRANNSSAFNFRYIRSSHSLSKHSLGTAVDINPLYNPYVRRVGGRTVVDPPEAAPYVDRTRDFPCKIERDDPCCTSKRRCRSDNEKEVRIVGPLFVFSAAACEARPGAGVQGTTGSLSVRRPRTIAGLRSGRLRPRRLRRAAGPPSDQCDPNSRSLSEKLSYSSLSAAISSRTG